MNHFKKLYWWLPFFCSLGISVVSLIWFAEENAQSVSLIAFIGLAHVLIFVGHCMLHITRISQPLSKISQYVKTLILTKDFTTKLDLKDKNEFTPLLADINTFNQNIDETLIQVRKSLARLAPMSQELADTNMGISQRNIMQHQRNQDISATLKEVESASVSVTDAITNIADASSLSQSTIDISIQAVNESVQSIHRLAHETESAMQNTMRLQDSSEQIGNVVDMIKNIAEQTNLLSLNAAIEAARAGESGRGFAVVADEVRALSMQTQEFTVKIEEMIQHMFSLVNEVMNTMQESKQTSERSVEHTDAVKEHFEKVQENITDITQKSRDISNAINEQSRLLRLVIDENGEMSQVSQDIVSSAEDCAISETDLMKLGDYIHRHLDVFTLSHTSFDIERRNHKTRKKAQGNTDTKVSAAGEVSLF